MTSTGAFSLVRTPLQNGPRRVTVASVEDVTPSYRRITLAGELSGFQSLGADDHLRIFFVPADFEAPEPGAGPEAFAAMRAHPSREYTPAAWTEDSLTLDFVLHGASGSDGPATAWALRAAPGDVAMIGGPRGSLVLEGRPDWWLLAGDRTALPAIRRFLGQVAAGTPVDVVLLAEDAADEQPLSSPGALSARWVRSLDELVAALAEVPAREGDGFAFIAAEQSIVKPGREYLQGRGVALDRAIVKGYWKLGEAEYHAPHGPAAGAQAG